jgi:hypothetical protein
VTNQKTEESPPYGAEHKPQRVSSGVPKSIVARNLIVSSCWRRTASAMKALASFIVGSVMPTRNFPVELVSFMNGARTHFGEPSRLKSFLTNFPDVRMPTSTIPSPVNILRVNLLLVSYKCI